MPELLVFVPCRRVITDRGKGDASLISLMEELTFTPNPTEELSLDAGAKLDWAVFSLWRWAEEELGRSYEQRLVLTRPDGRATTPTTVSFKAEKRQQRISIEVDGLPVGTAGDFLITISLHELESGAQVHPDAQFRLPIRHGEPEEITDDPASAGSES
jgi:hypothetical protein